MKPITKIKFTWERRPNDGSIIKWLLVADAVLTQGKLGVRSTGESVSHASVRDGKTYMTTGDVKRAPTYPFYWHGVRIEIPFDCFDRPRHGWSRTIEVEEP
jgi:hypothetical protein